MQENELVVENAEPARAEMREGTLQKVRSSLFRKRAPKIGFAILAGILVFVLLGELLIPKTSLLLEGPLNASPTFDHPFGTDYLGHDILGQVVWGALPSLGIAFASALGAVLIGFFAGVFSGYYRRLEGVLGGATDVVLTTPALPMIILAGSLFTATNTFLTAIIILFLWAPVSRVVRAQVLAVKRMPYVEASRTSGASDLQVIRKIIIPQVGPLGIAYFIVTIAISTIIVTAVEFIGVGNPLIVSLGSILYWAQQFAFLNGDWWWVLAPGLLITLFATGFALIGFSIEEILNPRLSE